MATIEEVVELWDETYPDDQTEALFSKNVQADGKIDVGRNDKWAVIKLADGYPYAAWPNRICYVFDFKGGKPEINFKKSKGYNCNIEKLFEFLDKNFKGHAINERKLKLYRSGNDLDYLTLCIEFDTNSSAENICDSMRKLIDLTRNSIREFLEKGG